MKIKSKKAIIALLIITSLLNFAVPVMAADQNTSIMPLWDVMDDNNISFIITSSGLANVVVRYTSDSSVFKEANLTVKIQKRTLLLFWTTVDIGEPNNEWTAKSTNINGIFNKSFPLDKTGTYRAVITLEIVGTNGKTDTIEETIECEYK